jgi:SAM-dependent methyltransferase
MKKVLYPVTRHFQRYEFVCNEGYIDDKTVIDVGCGMGAGAGMMMYFAKEVVAIDPGLRQYVKGSGDEPEHICPTYSFPDRPSCPIHFLAIPWEGIDTNKTKTDAVVAVEFIEHIRYPDKFLTAMAKITKYLFLTTPLAKKTAPTDNPGHVVEFSHDDLVALVSKEFDVIETKYQTGDLRIVDEATYQGSSINPNHIVQMLWCKRKESK